MSVFPTRQSIAGAVRTTRVVLLVLVGALLVGACDLEIPGFGSDDNEQSPVEAANEAPVPQAPAIQDPIEFDDAPLGQESQQVPDEAFQIEPPAADGDESATVRVVEAGVQEPRTLNPVLVSDPLAEELSQLVFSGLVRIDPETGDPVPDLAESWEVDDDQTIYTFRIRDDVFWHDGQEFTAQDVAFTFDLMMDDRTRSPRYSRVVERVAAVEALDAETIQFRLVSQYAPFLGTIATFGIIPQHLLNNVLPDELVAEPFGVSNAVGTGPFVFNRWERGERIIFDAFDQHPRGSAAITQYEYWIATDEDEILDGFRDGTVDWARVSVDAVPDVEAIDGVDVRSLPSYEMISVALQLDPAVSTTFEDPDLRRAMMYALDRETMIDLIWDGHASVAHSIIPEISWASADPSTRYEFDRSRAEEILDEAGWLPGEDGTRMRDDVPLQFSMIVNGDNPTRRALAGWLVEQWQEIGIDARAEFETWASVRDRITTSRQFEAMIFGYRWDVDPDQHPKWSSDSIPDGFNISGYMNRNVDQILENALVLNDQGFRAGLYADVQERVLQDLPVLPLAFPNQIVAVGPRLHAEEQTAILMRNRANVVDWIPENDEADEE